MTEYKKLAESCRFLLVQNNEWIDRYKGYIEKLEEVQGTVIESQSRFDLPNPLKLYLPLSSVMKCSNGEVTYDLRYQGQSASTLTVDTKKTKESKEDVSLQINKNSHFLSSENCQYKDYADSEKPLNWHTDDGAKAFRKTFQCEAFQSEDFKKHEHRLESYLLSNYSQKSSGGKEVLRIQPIGMCGTGAKFQMPTPFKASTLHDPRIVIDQSLYAGHYGGGIDILAKTGSGRGTYLTIIELKDENRVNESPQDAIRQAIAYTVFARELLRCEAAGNIGWWNFFGFHGAIPEKLKLRAVIAMPLEGTGSAKRAVEAEKNAKKFMTYVDQNAPVIEIENDLIELHYVFRENTETKTSLK